MVVEGDIINGLKRLQEYLVEEQLNGIVILSRSNLHYFAGFSGTTGCAFVTPEKAYFVADSRYIEQAQAQAEGYEVLLMQKSHFATLKPILSEYQLETLAFEGNQIPYDTVKTMQETFGDNITYRSITLEGIRAVKREDELLIMQKAATIADEAFAVLLTQVKPGMTEDEARIILEGEMLKRGSEGPSFDTIVASGHRSSMPHGVASSKVMEEGDFVTFDFGAIYKGYHSDITRTIVLGKASEEQKELYETVLAAQELGLSLVRPGISGKELDRMVRDVLAEKGYGDYFQHGLGHGVGLDIHEKPVTSPISNDVLEENMVVTIEPGVYFPGKHGIRIEDSVIVKASGAVRLTNTTKELLEINN